MSYRFFDSSNTYFSFTTAFKQFGLGLLMVVGFCLSGSAQDNQHALSARLVSEPGIPAGRPRSVSVAANLAAAVPTIAPSLEAATAIERRAFEKTNEERVKAGITALAWDADLCLFARTHSENMARLNFFGHETPEGMRLKERARAQGILHFRVIAENIAYNKGYEDPGAFAVERWMISSGHRANILYVGFQSSAIGSFVAKDGSVYLTQVFINR